MHNKMCFTAKSFADILPAVMATCPVTVLLSACEKTDVQKVILWDFTLHLKRMLRSY